MVKRFFTICLALMLCAAPILTGEAEKKSWKNPLAIENIFWYVPVEEAEQAQAEENAEANVRYMTRLGDWIEKDDTLVEGNALRIRVCEKMALNDMTALTWQVTNVTDQTLWVAASAFNASFSGIEYDVCGGYNYGDFVIRPGKTLDARCYGVLWEHFEPGMGQFDLNMTIYALTDEAAARADAVEADQAFFPKEGEMSLLEEMTFAVPMEMKQSETHSALPDGQPVEQAMNRYTLRVTQADLTDVGAQLALERIYESEAAARADSPHGEQFWQYTLLTPEGVQWVKTSFGSLADEPVRREDGRWAWTYEVRVYFMYAMPKQVVLRAERFDGTEWNDEAQEDFLLDFLGTDE